MTHAEVQGRLGLYARGALDDEQAARVRAHLASGCSACLSDLFAHPRRTEARPSPSPAVTLPAVEAILTAQTALVPPPTRRRSRTLPLAALAAACVGLAVGVVARTRSRDGVGRPVGASGADSDLPTAMDPVTSLERRLDDVERRVDVASAVPGPGNGERTVPAWLEDLLSTDGTRAIPLHASAIADGARGYALWTPSRDTVVIVGSALATGQGVYRVRVELSDGSPVYVGDLEANARGTVVATVGLPPAAGRTVVGVALYRDPPNLPALFARLEP